MYKGRIKMIGRNHNGIGKLIFESKEKFETNKITTCIFISIILRKEIFQEIVICINNNLNR